MQRVMKRQVNQMNFLENQRGYSGRAATFGLPEGQWHSGQFYWLVAGVPVHLAHSLIDLPFLEGGPDQDSRCGLVTENWKRISFK